MNFLASRDPTIQSSPFAVNDTDPSFIAGSIGLFLLVLILLPYDIFANGVDTSSFSQQERSLILPMQKIMKQLSIQLKYPLSNTNVPVALLQIFLFVRARSHQFWQAIQLALAVPLLYVGVKQAV